MRVDVVAITPGKLLLEYKQRIPFYREPWFLVVLAAASLVAIILVVAVLCVKSKTHRYKQVCLLVFLLFMLCLHLEQFAFFAWVSNVSLSLSRLESFHLCVCVYASRA